MTKLFTSHHPKVCIINIKMLHFPHCFLYVLAEPVKIEDTDSEEDNVVVLKTKSPAKRAKKKKNT